MGNILFFMLWPLVWFYAPLRVRVRVMIVQQGKILLVKNWFGPGQWQLPGGGMKFGESMKAAAVRELKEELKVDVGQVHLRQLTEQPVIVKQFGLLMRYHFLVWPDSEIKDIAIPAGISDYTWQKTKQLHHTATEVRTGLSLM